MAPVMVVKVSAIAVEGLDDLAFVKPIRSIELKRTSAPARTCRPRGRRCRPPIASHALQKHDLFHTFHEPRSSKPANQTAIFIHDFLTDSRLFTPLVNTAELQPYNLLTYDIRGFGRSPDPHAPYSRSEDIHSLYPHPAHLVGSGLGGVVALEYALSHPDYVTSVTVVGSGLPGHRWSQESFLDITKARTIGRFLGAGAHLQGRDKDLVAWKQLFIASNKTWDVLREGDQQVAKALIEMARTYRGFHFFDEDPLVPRPMETLPLVDRLGGVRVPLQVIVGDADTEDFREISRVICAGVPGDHDVDIVKDAGHFAVLEQPNVIAPKLISFWEQLVTKPQASQAVLKARDQPDENDENGV